MSVVNDRIFVVFLRYKTQGHSGTPGTSATFYLILDVMTFFDTFHTNKYQEALDVGITHIYLN